MEKELVEDYVLIDGWAVKSSSIEGFFKNIKDLVERLEARGWKELEIGMNPFNLPQLAVYGKRLETDEEYSYRLKIQSERQKMQQTALETFFNGNKTDE